MFLPPDLNSSSFGQAPLRLDHRMASMLLSHPLVSSSRIVRPWTPLGARWIGHTDITWSAVCSSAPHSHSGVGARPHLCIHERKRPTPVLKRFSLTQASLGKSSPEGSDPAVGRKAWSLESDSRYSFFHIWFVQSVARISKLERFSSILRAAGTNGRRDINLSCHFSGGLTN